MNLFPLMIILFAVLSNLTSSEMDPLICKEKKVIRLHLSKSGLSNRLYALVSVTMLAAAMNRILEVDWEADKGAGIEFGDLFDHVESGGSMSPSPFILLGNNRTPSSFFDTNAVKNSTSCRIDLSHQGESFPIFFYDASLFMQLSRRCDILHVYRANLWYGTEVLNLDEVLLYVQDQPDAMDIITRVKKIKRKYPAPFRDFMNAFYVPKKSLTNRTIQFQRDHFHGKPYLAIHARGFYDNGLST